MTKKVKPELRFSMERDGFFGEYYRAADNRFPGKCMIAFGGSVGKFLLSRMMAWEFAASGMRECAAERKQSWEDTLAFLRVW